MPLIKILPRLPYNPKLKQRAAEMRQNMTKAERIIWFKYLKNLNVRVLRQRPIDNFIVDFYIPSLRIVIEIDGEIHDDRKEYDDERSNILEGFGLEVIRFSNDDIINHFEGVCVKLDKIF